MGTRKDSIFTLMKACARAWTLIALAIPAWFGHMRYATPIVHSDDHKDLARQALRHLMKQREIDKGSPLAKNAELVAASCGMLDLDESEMAKTPGRLTWEHSHMFDPVAMRGTQRGREVNALDEFIDWWHRALMHADIGNAPKAYRFLGYCCHLLQDMAVPSHTYCVSHGLRPRIADNLELVSSSRRFHLRLPAGPPFRGDPDTPSALFIATGRESRGLDPADPQEDNELREILEKYYEEPREESGGWHGAYIGESYYPYHRFLPSSPRIELLDLVTLRNHLMARAAERTAQLIAHFADITRAGEPS
jgi:hypothetical protein